MFLSPSFKRSPSNTWKPSVGEILQAEDSHDYFLKQIDHIISKCVVYLLCVQPDNVPLAMLEYLSNYKEGVNIDIHSRMNIDEATTNRYDHKLYLENAIDPIVAKLTSRLAHIRPESEEKVLEFLIHELTNMPATKSWAVTVNT